MYKVVHVFNHLFSVDRAEMQMHLHYILARILSAAHLNKVT